MMPLMSKGLLIRSRMRMVPFFKLNSSSFGAVTAAGGVLGLRRGYGIYTPPNPDPISVKVSSGDGKSGGKLGFPATYDELPTPTGSWQAEYNKKNSRYNKQLFLGITMFTGTIIAIRSIVDFNGSIPELSDPMGDMCAEIKPKC